MALVLLVATRVSQAVVVAGANGGGTENTTQAELEAALSINGSFFQNVIQYSNSGGVYLGYANTVDGLRAYALTATHISPDVSTVTIDGQIYTVVSGTQINNSDVSLLTLSQASNIMPSYAAVSLATSTPAIGTDIIMIGYGQERVQASTTSATVSDAVDLGSGETGYTTINNDSIKRWGTNETVGISVSGTVYTAYPIALSGTTVITASVFDEPVSGDWLTSNEAQAVKLDSGGGMFGMDGTLLGLMASVSSPGSTDVAYFGRATFFSDIATYQPAIQAAIGYSLIPEPSTFGLLFAGILGIFFWRTRQQREAVLAVAPNARRIRDSRDNYDPSGSL